MGPVVCTDTPSVTDTGGRATAVTNTLDDINGRAVIPRSGISTGSGNSGATHGDILDGDPKEFKNPLALNNFVTDANGKPMLATDCIVEITSAQDIFLFCIHRCQSQLTNSAFAGTYHMRITKLDGNV